MGILEQLTEVNEERSMEAFDMNVSEWSISEWAVAASGEMGELLNWIKKFNRGDFDYDKLQSEAKKEIADTIIYLDLLCKRLGIDLGEAIKEKFNEVSKKRGSQYFIK